MNIERNNHKEVVITGNIKTIDDSIQIKKFVSELVASGNHAVHLNIKDSLSMSSTVIGFLMTLVHNEKVQLSITVGDNRLYTLLDELDLVQEFKVRCAAN